MLLFVMVCIGTAVWAQPKINSPFSRFGLGDIREPNFAPVNAMGGISAAYHHPYITNIANPASYGYLKATSFEFGVFAQYAELKKDDFQENVWSGNLDYLSLSIPLINPINNILERREGNLSGGLNISISPYSQVGYLVFSDGPIDSLGNVENLFRGVGGTNRLNVGTGWKYKNISAGINIGYLFGALEYQTITTFNDLENRYDHVSQNNFSLRGFLYDIGVMYDLKLKQSQRKNRRWLTVGAHFNTSTSFSGEDDFLNYVVNDVTNDSDTSAFLVDAPVNGKLPGEFGIGLHYEEENRIRAGVSLTATQWGQYENSARPEVLNDAWRLAAGASITPDITSITSYFERVEYRAGAFYGTDPRTLGGEQATDYGVSLGFGFPFIQQRLFSYLELTFEYGWRGVTDSLKENYLRFRLGLNLNDTQWFIKRRFN